MCSFTLSPSPLSCPSLPALPLPLPLSGLHWSLSQAGGALSPGQGAADSLQANTHRVPGLPPPPPPPGRSPRGGQRDTGRVRNCPSCSRLPCSQGKD